MNMILTCKYKNDAYTFYYSLFSAVRIKEVCEILFAANVTKKWN